MLKFRVKLQAHGAEILEHCVNEGLLYVQEYIEGFNFTMEHFGLPVAVRDAVDIPRTVWKEMRSDQQRAELQTFVEQSLPQLNCDQRAVYDCVLQTIHCTAEQQVHIHHASSKSLQK